MLVGSFKSLWNRAVFYVGLGWLVLIALIWNTDQLATSADRQIYIGVIAAGFLLVYVSGFIIEAMYKRKQAANR
ncbi:MAG: hypothetical protein ISR54_00555 [Chlorobium phaeobacteroides]|uniref:Uncharacterized protein n=1 Tax=Chlorobium phaeobacteroides (strain BS1) TaxID=331678 RepID=B3EL11_CHLPB|nr:hypothetical protein [Chlorobium phaeobacteroides]MBL6955303.1 hypothetical protein [Chlorobium phaeobacteroides]